jgi:hypothetical protein
MALRPFSEQSGRCVGGRGGAPAGMFTIFQVMTGDAWGDIARGLFVTTGSPLGTALFFVSFQLIVSLVLLNVVIAVLLDEFSKAAEQRGPAAGPAGALTAGDGDGEGRAVDRLAADLSDFRDSDDLEERIAALYALVSRGAAAGPPPPVLGYDQLRAGIVGLGHIPPVLLQLTEWDERVIRPGLAETADGPDGPVPGLGPSGFAALMRRAVREHSVASLSRVAADASESWSPEAVRALLVAVKGVLLRPAAAPAPPRRPPPADPPSPAGGAGGVGPPPGPGGGGLSRLVDEATAVCAELDALGDDLRAARAARAAPAPPVEPTARAAPPLTARRRLLLKTPRGTSRPATARGPAAQPPPEAPQPAEPPAEPVPPAAPGLAAASRRQAFMAALDRQAPLDLPGK